MHVIDRVISLRYTLLRVTNKAFPAGWGDDRLLALMDTAGDFSAPPPPEIRWGPSRAEGRLTIADGSFESHVDALPPGARIAHVRRIDPAVADGRLVVMVAAWNDHGYATRTRLAVLLADRGITTVMLENPLYGRRKVADGSPVRSVADFAVMGRAAVEEAVALLGHYSSTHRVGVAGYSMGGNIAALAGALSEQPVAIAALAASHSPGPVWLDGIIRATIDWEALGGESQSDRLRRVLGRATVLAIPPAPHTAKAVIVGGTGDGYIPRTAVEALHAHWPGAELRWLPGGHASLMVFRRPHLAQAISDALDRR